MNKPSFSDRLRYAFDNTMSKGPMGMIGWLGALSLVVVALGALVLTLGGFAQEGEEPLGFVEAFWESLMRTLDAGTMGADTGWGFRLVMFAVTIGGIFVISTLIGVLTSGVEGKIDELRKGRSKVIESNHTVILGWAEQIFAIISELSIANANQADSCIVVLADKDKVEMEDEIRDKVGDTGRTRVVCRTGSPIEMNNLEIASVHTARSVIILSPEGDDPDSQVIKSILAITNNPNRRPEPYHIVAEIHEPRNMEVAKMVGKDEVELVLIGSLVSRIMAQTCRQSGLSVVYTELLDFGGDEIYFKEEPALVGKTFGEALLAYEDSAIMGLSFKDGSLKLNPSMDTRIQAGDSVIAISADDDTIRLSGLQDLGIKREAIQTARPAAPAPEHTLILGWNWHAATVINELDRYVAPGSVLTIVADVPQDEVDLDALCPDIENQKITFKVGDTTDRRLLDKLEVTSYDHIIALCSDTLEPQEADARTLITLLHLRDIANKTGQDFSIVSQMLDVRNRNLAEVTRADDFIVSDKLISLMLSQISENKALNAVLTDIFDPDGSEVYLKPVENYVKTGEPVNFYTVVEAARQRGEVAIGYRQRAFSSDADRSYGVVVNPDKSASAIFSAGDRIIVLAEE